MDLPFTKMEGLGNTFVFFKGPLVLSNEEVVRYCKEYGADGADGLIIVTPVNSVLVELKYWNGDGSVAEMCGNGLRCVTRFAVENHFVQPESFTVKTDAGLLTVVWDGKDAENIEVQAGKTRVSPFSITLSGHLFYEVNVGNPHAVTFVDSAATAPVHDVGPKVETDEHFPYKTNVKFVEVYDQHKIRMRVWERGVGETMACGTGMVAAANIAVKIKQLEFPLDVEVLGGKATIWEDDEGYTRMIGPAKVVVA